MKKFLKHSLIGSFEAKNDSVVILYMLQFIPSNTQLLARALSSHLGCLKNTSRNHLSSNSLLKLGKKHHTAVDLGGCSSEKNQSPIFLLVVSSVKNNYFYKISL